MKKIILLLLLINLFSCAEKGQKKPKDLISKDKMADLLFDIHVANKTRNIINLNNKKNINYLSIVSEKYHIDSMCFKDSHAYYMRHLDQYKEIYKKIETRFDTLIKKQEKVVEMADSIKRTTFKKKHKK